MAQSYDFWRWQQRADTSLASVYTQFNGKIISDKVRECCHCTLSTFSYSGFFVGRERLTGFCPGIDDDNDDDDDDDDDDDELITLIVIYFDLYTS